MPASVLGLDFGGSSAKIAKVENGGVVIVNNELSQRSTPAVLSLPYDKVGSRIAGASASPHLISHPENTVGELRNLLGTKNLKPENVGQLREAGKVNYYGNSGGITVNHRGQDRVWQPEQLVAAYLTHLQENVVDPAVNEEDKSSESFYVFSVPHYFTDQERSSILNACAIAKINNVDLINDLSAAALAYGYFLKDLPKEEEQSKPIKVAFVDFGYSGIQSSLVEFTAGGMKVVNVQFDRRAGGRDLDQLLADRFADEFVAKNPSLDGVYGNKKAMTKLLNEAEKVKRQMSANKNKIPVNVECLLDGIDFNGSISREEFEEISQDVFVKVESCLRRLLVDSECKVSDLHGVEVIGGSSRVPTFKSIVQNVFKKPPSTTLNADEAVAKGAALYCAATTKVYSVRQYQVQDIGTSLDIQMKHAVVRKSEARKSDDEDEDALTVTTNLVETAKTYRIFGSNENKFEATVYLKERPDGDTIALEYDASAVPIKSLVAIYQLNLPDLKDGEKIALLFRLHRSQPRLVGAKIVSPTDGEKPVNFTESRVGGLTGSELSNLSNFETAMVEEDKREYKRQELKNNFEDTIFRSRDELNGLESRYAKEEAWRDTMAHVKQFQNVISIDDTYEHWTPEQFEARLNELNRRMGVFHVWQRKYEQHLQLQSRKQRVSDEFQDESNEVENPLSRIGQGFFTTPAPTNEELLFSGPHFTPRSFSHHSPFVGLQSSHSPQFVNSGRPYVQSHRYIPDYPYHLFY